MKYNLLLLFTLIFLGCNAQEKRLNDAILSYMHEDSLTKVEQFKILDVKKLTEQEYLQLVVEKERSIYILCESNVYKLNTKLEELIHDRDLYREGTPEYRELNIKIEKQKKELAKEEQYKIKYSNIVDSTTNLAMHADNTKEYGYLVLTTLKWLQSGKEIRNEETKFLVTKDMKVSMYLLIEN